MWALLPLEVLMHYTLLEIIQRVLSAMGADNVNSIDGTAESTAVARIAEEVYYDLLATSDWPHLEQMTRLEGYSDSNSPTTLEIPTAVKYVKAFWYNDKELIYKEPSEFIRLMNAKNSSNVDKTYSVLPNGIPFEVVNNTDPQYFTVIENEYIVTDSFDAAQGSTLHGSRSYLVGNIIPTFYSVDEFVPELDTAMFSTYLAMVKRAAFMYLRQEPSPHDERVAVAGLGRIMQDKYKLYRKETKISYGRK